MNISSSKFPQRPLAATVGHRRLDARRDLAPDALARGQEAVEVTLSDLRLFATLVRFDSVYYTHFKVNRRRVADYSNLWGFVRDLYGLPGVAQTVSVDHIKEHYYRSHTDINPTGFVPVGPETCFGEPHDRTELGDLSSPLV